MEKKPFENLPIKRRVLNNDGLRAYRIYKDRTDFIVTKGKNADEAIKASGVTQPFRVMLHDVMEETVLDVSALKDYEKPAPPAEAAPMETTVTEEVVTEPAPAAEAPVEAPKEPVS